VQGTAADIIKKALILIHNRLPGTGSRLFSSVHDEIILEAAKEYAVHASKILRDSMVESGAFYLKTVPVEVDLHLDESWAGK
jgi:DNA polymerase-1